MAKKTGLTGVLLLAAVFTVIVPVPATAQIQIIDWDSEARQGQILTIVSDEPGTWTVEAGVLDINTGTMVNWTLPATVPTNPRQLHISVIADSDGTTSEKTVNVYTGISIRDKGSIEPLYYPGLTQSMSASGGRGEYTWTLTLPTGAEVIEAISTEDDYTFTAPSTGEFAGVYTATVSDGLPDGDWIDLYVFAWLDGDIYFMLENSTPVVYTLTGALDGVAYQVKLLAENNDKATDYTLFTDEYGTINLSNNGVSNGGVLTMTYTPPADTSEQRSFWLRGLADQEVNYSIGSYSVNLYDVWLGPIVIRNSNPLHGLIVEDDLDRTPISDARVLLLAPEQYTGSRVTGVDGRFEFIVPEGSKYWFFVDKDGYVPRYFTSKTIDDNGGRIKLEQAFCQGVSGAIDDGAAALSAGDTIRVSLVDFNNGTPVVRSETMVVKPAKKGLINYRLDLAKEDLPNGDKFAVIAYTPGFSATTLFSVPANETPIFGFDLTLAPANGNENYRLEPTSDWIAPPLKEVTGITSLGGFAYSAFDENDELSAKFDIRPGTINNALLKDGEHVDITWKAYANPFIDRSYSVFVNGSKTLFRLGVETAEDINGNRNKHILSSRKIIISLPFDLIVVNFGDFERQRYFARHGDNQTELETALAREIPLGDILAIDYIGDGQYGWVTFQMAALSVFGVGMTESSSSQYDADYKYPTFERYEIYGCFVESAK